MRLSMGEKIACIAEQTTRNSAMIVILAGRLRRADAIDEETITLIDRQLAEMATEHQYLARAAQTLREMLSTARK